MKSFSEFIFERVELRARKHMPQISNMDGFLKDLKDNGYKITHTEVDAKSLKPTQSEFNMEKVKGMIASGAYKNKSIVTTDDNYILDGHHRWKAHMQQDEKQPIVKVNMKFDDLFDFVDGKKYIKYKQLHEFKLTEWYNTNTSMADYMTDEEKEKEKQAKVDKVYQDFFTPEMFNQVFNSIKEDGEGGGGEASASTGTGPTNAEPATQASTGEEDRDNENKLNSVANVSMPNVMNKHILRRRNGRADDDSDIVDDGGDGGGD